MFATIVDIIESPFMVSFYTFKNVSGKALLFLESIRHIFL